MDLLLANIFFFLDNLYIQDWSYQRDILAHMCQRLATTLLLEGMAIERFWSNTRVYSFYMYANKYALLIVNDRAYTLLNSGKIIENFLSRSTYLNKSFFNVLTMQAHSYLEIVLHLTFL